MFYTLCHKDIPVLDFKMEDGEITDVLEIQNKSHLPIGVFNKFEKGVTPKQQFKAWWKGRMIPSSRQNLNDALNLLGGITTEMLVEKSFGLSLSDQYWARPMDSGLSWKSVNFFENDFSDDVGKALFGTLDIKDISNIDLLSPNNTSDGWLRKKWIIDGGERILLKGGSDPFQQEPFNEVLASEIFRRLGIPCVDYTVAEHSGRYYSACKDFVTTSTELVSAWRVAGVLPRANNVSAYKHLLNCCEALEMKDIPEIEKRICQMIAVDCMVLNTDRHYNNFGFIRNADTLEWQGMAPIFDTGTSMFHAVSDYDLKNRISTGQTETDSKPFAKTHGEQIKKLPCREFCADLPFENLDGIRGFAEKLHSQNRHISDERRNVLCAILEERVRETRLAIKKPYLAIRSRRAGRPDM